MRPPYEDGLKLRQPSLPKNVKLRGTSGVSRNFWLRPLGAFLNSFAKCSPKNQSSQVRSPVQNMSHQKGRKKEAKRMPKWGKSETEWFRVSDIDCTTNALRNNRSRTLVAAVANPIKVGPFRSGRFHSRRAPGKHVTFKNSWKPSKPFRRLNLAKTFVFRKRLCFTVWNGMEFRLIELNPGSFHSSSQKFTKLKRTNISIENLWIRVWAQRPA